MTSPMGEPLGELVTLIREKASNRLALVISNSDVFLNSPKDASQVYILELEISNAGGGRGGGYGSRNISRVRCFRFENGVWTKKADINDNELPEGFAPPHHVSLFPLTLGDGREVVVYGAVDPALVAEYDQKFLYTTME